MRPLLVVSPEEVSQAPYGFPDVGIVLYVVTIGVISPFISGIKCPL